MELFVTFILGVFVLAGAAVAGFAKNGRQISEISIAVALGAMAMLLLDDLLPEALENASFIGWPISLVGVALGVLVLLALDKFLPESHHGAERAESGDSTLHISIAATIALVAHNIVEGMSVFSLSQQSMAMAWALVIGVGLHNIPMGMIIYSGLREASLRRRVIVLGFAVFSTFFGGLLMLALSSTVDPRLVPFMVCITIGLLCYIIFFELLPHVVRTDNKKQAILFILVGVAAVAASGFFESLV